MRCAMHAPGPSPKLAGYRVLGAPGVCDGEVSVLVVHTTNRVVPPDVVPYKAWQATTDCDPNETVQDLIFMPTALSFRQVARDLKDPGRPKDRLVFDRLARASAWGIWLDAEALAERLVDPASNPFALAFGARAGENFWVNDVKNAIKRLRQAADRAGLDGRQVIAEADGEYHVTVPVSVKHVRA
jgi:hypothetical protein